MEVFAPRDIEQAIKAGTPFKTYATSLSINPSDDHFSQRDLQTLAVSILANPQLTCLSLMHVKRIDPAGWGILMNAFNQTTITQLTITGVPLYNRGLSDLCSMLKSNKKITHLYLLQIRANDYSDLGDALAENTTLKSLYIQMPNARNFNIGLESLAQGLSNNVTLERLRISSIEARAFEAICNALQSHPRIQALEFYQTYEALSPECTVALRNVLETNKSLLKLSLDSCKIDQDSCAAICEGLIGNSTLKELILDGNNLNSISCSALAQLLKHNTSLKRLSLNKNIPLAAEGMTEICSSLLENSTLDWLDIRGNTVDGAFYTTLKQLIARNTSLNRLDITDIYFDRSYLLRIADELKQNKNLRTIALNIAHDEATASLWCIILAENESLTDVGACNRTVSKSIQFQMTEYLERNRRQQNASVANVILTLFSIARDSRSLNNLPLELWFHVCKLIKIPGVPIDWQDIFRKIFENKNQLKVLEKTYL